jgi:uncharacterized protein YdiU (UPF0061 family)
MSHLSLAQLSFDNRFVQELPADPVTDNYRRQVAGACYSLVKPTPVRAPTLVCAATDVADLIGLHHNELNSDFFAQIFSGNQLLAGMQSHACCYGGHQFGNWAGQLGDGRAINLGEVKTAEAKHWTLQLKGAGPTPYSRTADGLAVLRSSVREFLCSEAMHHLGVPTTRALSLMTTGEQVRRDMFYDGNSQMEPGAVVCRVAQSFTRFGNFEILSARKDLALLKKLTDFTIRTDFPQLVKNGEELNREIYLQWFEEISIRTAQMIAHWMRVGFVHGVMNTDNMSILGLTIDYGPYGWLEGYDPDWTPNTTDAQGRRYRFINQPQIALWNLAQLGNAIYPLIEAVEPLQEGLNVFRRVYAEQWQADMANKLGFKNFTDDDIQLVDELHKVLQLTETDMTIFYRLLANVDMSVGATADDKTLVDTIEFAYYTDPTIESATAMANWLRAYSERLQQDYIVYSETHAQRKARMNQVNPKYILRNYMAQQAIDKATEGDYSEVQHLLQVLRNPYCEQPEYDYYFAKRPEWARSKAGCSMLSCSS